MLKNLSTESAEPKKGVVGVNGDSRAGRNGGKLDGSVMDNVKVDGGKIGKKGQNPSKCKNLSKSKKTELGFLTSGTRRAFTKLRQAFIKAPILHNFDLERHIWVETNVSGYAISGVVSQLTLDNSGQCYPMAFFTRKMIPAEIRYKTYNGELLAIVETFKTWRHYLEGSRHEMLVLTDHNNLCRFMKSKSLSSRQVHWA